MSIVQMTEECQAIGSKVESIRINKDRVEDLRGILQMVADGELTVTEGVEFINTLRPLEPKKSPAESSSVQDRLGQPYQGRGFRGSAGGYRGRFQFQRGGRFQHRSRPYQGYGGYSRQQKFKPYRNVGANETC